MKTCKDAEKVIGCGKEQPDVEFEIFPNCSSSFCKSCFSKYRKKVYRDKKTINNITSMRW